MDDKEFRKLRREDLIEIIYQYQRREQRLTQENERLRSQLEDRQIRMEKTGSIAEAALALSGVFEAAQKAADLYLQSVAAGPGAEPIKKTGEPVKMKDTAVKAVKTSPAPEQKPVEAVKQPVKELGPKTVSKEKSADKALQTSSEKPAENTVQKDIQNSVKQKNCDPGSVKTTTSKNTSLKATKSVEKTEKTDVSIKKKPETPQQKIKSGEKPAPEVKSPVIEKSKPAEEKKTAAPKTEEKKVPAQKPQKPAASQNKAPASQEKKPHSPASKESQEVIRDPGGETDAFIASLKEYLGM